VFIGYTIFFGNEATGFVGVGLVEDWFWIEDEVLLQPNTINNPKAIKMYFINYV
jgi:hypothetical protein